MTLFDERCQGGLGNALEIEPNGDDEHDATRAVEQVFSSHDSGDASDSVTERNL
jgi:hypothetical protein